MMSKFNYNGNFSKYAEYFLHTLKLYLKIKEYQFKHLIK